MLNSKMNVLIEIDREIPMDEMIYEQRAEILKAMAHPARLKMIDALSSGEKCVCELQELVGSAMPTVSRHLSQMKAAGVVACRRDGNNIYYRLLVPCVLNVFDCIAKAIDSDDAEMAEKAESSCTSCKSDTGAQCRVGGVSEV